MAEINIDYRIIITGLACLTVMALGLILDGSGNNTLLISGIIAIIAWSIGYVIPSPKIDNNKGIIKLSVGC